MTSFYQELRGILSSKATELFADYGVACTVETTAPLTSSQLCGILGFTGDRLCGSVVIAATVDALAASNPIGDGATRGWVAELTNQLVGRFKNELYRGGVEVAMSVPIVLTATRLTPLGQEGSEPIRLLVANGVVAIWLEIEADPTLVLAEPSPDTMMAEGDAMMF